MPGLDGLTVLTRLHRDCPALPVIAVMANVEKDQLIDLKRADATDYVTKPLDYSDLLSKISRHF